MNKKTILILLLIFFMCGSILKAQAPDDDERRVRSERKPRPERRTNVNRPAAVTTPANPGSQSSTAPGSANPYSSNPSSPDGKLPLPVQMEQKAVQSLRSGKILLNFEGADIRVVAKLISELTRKNIIMDERVKGKISILSAREVSTQEAWSMFVTALNAYGYDVVDWGTTAKIIPLKNAQKEKAKFYSEENAAQAAGMGDEYLVAVVALKNADPNQIANVLRQLATESGVVMPYPPSKSVLLADSAYNVKRLIKLARHMDTVRDKPIIRTYYLKWADSTEVVRALEQIYKPNEKEVTISDFPSNNAVIAVAANYQLKEIENLIREMDRFVDTRDRTRKFRVIQLENAVADDVAKLLSEMLKESQRVEEKTTFTPTGRSTTSAAARRSRVPASQMGAPAAGGTPGTPASPGTIGGVERGTTTATESKSYISSKVSADVDTNSIILYVTDAEMEEIRPMIAKLDSVRKQVLVSAVIAEVAMSRLKSSGANWQVITKSGTGAAFGGGKSLDSIYQILSSGNFVLGGIGNDKTTINIGGRKLEFPDVFALIQFLNEDNDFNILSAPKVLTLDHKEAIMNVGSIIPFATGIKFDANGQPVITYDYKDVGLNLTVTPHIGQGKTVKMEVSQKIQDVTDYVQQNIGAIGYVVPVVSSRTVDTTISINDSQTIIIGGLVSKKTIESIKKVPLLGDIPIIGAAFKNRKKENSKTTLFIFLTPHIIDDPKKLSEITDRYQHFAEEKIPRKGEKVEISPSDAEITNESQVRKP
jgi:general secretion pathway protein D